MQVTVFLDKCITVLYTVIRAEETHCRSAQAGTDRETGEDRSS